MQYCLEYIDIDDMHIWWEKLLINQVLMFSVSAYIIINDKCCGIHQFIFLFLTLNLHKLMNHWKVTARHFAVVDVYQEWSGPCNALSGHFRRIMIELSDKLLQFAIVSNIIFCFLKAINYSSNSWHNWLGESGGLQQKRVCYPYSKG